MGLPPHAFIVSHLVDKCQHLIYAFCNFFYGKKEGGFRPLDYIHPIADDSQASHWNGVLWFKSFAAFSAPDLTFQVPSIRAVQVGLAHLLDPFPEGFATPCVDAEMVKNMFSIFPFSSFKTLFPTSLVSHICLHLSTFIFWSCIHNPFESLVNLRPSRRSICIPAIAFTSGPEDQDFPRQRLANGPSREHLVLRNSPSSSTKTA